MKIIFLDHFGVMCLADKHGRVHGKEDRPRSDEMRVHGKFDNFNKETVKVLNEILIETGAEIVVSSDWKRWASIEELGEFYISQGICKKPIDVTPELNNISDVKVQRSLEILKWLEINDKIDSLAVIDDMYLEGLFHNFVWVSRTDQGITQDGIKEKLIEKLLI